MEQEQWITDERGNRASVGHWGSEAAARAALASNADCTNCTNCDRCTRCVDCTDCTGCTNCTNCTDCTDCNGCTRCVDCAGCTRCVDCAGCTRCTRCADCAGCTACFDIRDAANPLVVGPTRSDGYHFVMGASRSIHAGCRVFVSLGAARLHWQETRGGTLLGAETQLILNYLEQAAALNASTRS